MVIHSNLVVLVLFEFLVTNFATLTPPYTCTTTTTLCQPGVGGETTIQTPFRGNVTASQGKPGKRGPIGMTGPKGEKGDACHCDIADEKMVNDVRKQMDKIENDYEKVMNNTAFGEFGSVANPAKSCFHLKINGQNLSGIYYIKTHDRSATIQVFCDMESAGGGWTLVASVHENNINGKCTAGDLWSSDQTHVGDDNRGNGNWENLNVFGSPEAATSADYKSQAYYGLQASDVMIWHVPNNVQIGDASSEAIMKYYTDNAFLENYGGNLQSLYSEYFPLVKRSVETTPGGSLPDLMSSLRDASAGMVSSISGFHSYNYDQASTTNNFISDGGGDMFDGGNKIYYQIGSNPESYITYGEHYENSSRGVEFISSADQHPFHALMWIENNGRREQTYAIRAFGDAGADGNGNANTRTGSLSRGQLQLSYHAYSIYGASDPSICEVFYTVTSPSWGSVLGTVTREPWISGTAALNQGIQISGAPKSVLVGYTLLSRTSANEVTVSHIEGVLTRILAIIPEDIVQASCDHTNGSLIQPVIYLKGDSGQTTLGIPPTVRGETTPGFLQFRPYNGKGVPNALCPGVRTTSCHPEYFCVGGINTNSRDPSVCGDYAGWQGESGDSPTATLPSGSSKSLNDIDSSILIFTRSQE